MLKLKPLLSSVQRPVEKFGLGTLAARSTCRAAVLCGWLGLLGTLVPVAPANSFQASQDNAAESPPPRIVGPFLSREDVGPFTRVVFKNGLTVLLFERSNTPLVAMVTYVKAGRGHQDASSRGFWDLWTPLLFHSPLPGGEGTVAGEARRIGAVLDTGVGEDHAWFSTVLPREAYRRGLDLQVTAVDKWNPSAREGAGTRTARSRQRRRFRQGPPEREYGRQLFDLALQKGRGARMKKVVPPAARMASTALNSVAFTAVGSSPGNVLLAITGDFDRRALLREIVKRYRSLPKGPTLDPPAVPTPHDRRLQLCLSPAGPASSRDPHGLSPAVRLQPGVVRLQGLASRSDRGPDLGIESPPGYGPVAGSRGATPTRLFRDRPGYLILSLGAGRSRVGPVGRDRSGRHRADQAGRPG